MFYMVNYSNLIDLEGLTLFISIVGNSSISTQSTNVPTLSIRICHGFNSIGTAER